MNDKRNNKADKGFEDLISVSCHYTDDILITKLGYLVQTLCMPLSDLGSDNDWIENIIDNVRNAILVIPSRNIAVYLHLIRDSSSLLDIEQQNVYVNPQILKKNIEYIKSQNIENNMTNTLYITIVHRGLSDDFSNNPLKNILFRGFINSNKRILDRAIEDLNDSVNGVMGALHMYKLRKLSIVKDGEIYYSEPLSFYSYLLFQDNSKIPIAENDFANILGKNKEIEYFGNYICIHNKTTDKKKYIALFSLKYQPHRNNIGIDKLLNSKIEAIFTEIVIFVNSNKIANKYKKHMDLYNAGEATALKNHSNIERFADPICIKNGANFVQQQLMIFLHADTETLLEEYMSKLKEICDQSSIIGIIEDLYIPTGFFANLPGNAIYALRTIDNIPYEIGVFNSTNFNSGCIDGNLWGKYLAIFANVNSYLPYYFNFHNNDKIGHTIILGDEYVGQRLINFMIANATKLNVGIVCIDIRNEFESMFEMINGKHIEMFGEVENLSFDMGIKIDLEYKELIEAFVLKRKIDLSEWNQLVDICIRSKQLPDSFFNIINSLDYIEHSNNATNEDNNEDLSSCAQTISEFLCSKKYKRIVEKQGSKKLDQYISVENMKYLRLTIGDLYFLESQISELFIFLLLNKLTKMMTNNNPLIIVMAQGDLLFKHHMARPMITRMMSDITSRNGILLTCVTDKSIIDSDEASDLLRAFPNQFFISDRNLTNAQRKHLDLSEDELNTIRAHSVGKNFVYLKRKQRMEKKRPQFISLSSGMTQFDLYSTNVAIIDEDIAK